MDSRGSGLRQGDPPARRIQKRHSRTPCARHFPPEIANGLASAERQKRIRVGESAVFSNDVLVFAPVLHHSALLLVRAMEIAVSNGQAVYDCIYLALAEAEGCKLVTADDQFARGLQSSFPFIVSLVALP